MTDKNTHWWNMEFEQPENVRLTITEGMALVPLTPTKAMLDAMIDAFRESTCFDDRPFESASDAARDAYSRMLAASRLPQKSEG